MSDKKELDQRIKELRVLGDERRRIADKVEGKTQDPDRASEKVWPGCMPRPAQDGVPYTVAQLRAAYEASRTTEEEKEENIGRKRRVFFCQQLQKDDKMWRELLQHPEKYGAGPKIDIDLKSSNEEELRERIKELQKQNESCASNLRLSQADAKVFREKVSELRRAARNRVRMLKNIHEIFSGDESLNLVFRNIDIDDQKQVEKWRSHFSGEQLAEFDKRLEELRKAK